MKNIDKELVKAMMDLKEMLDLLKMVDPEELCFEKLRFFSSYHRCHKLENSIITSLWRPPTLLLYIQSLR